MTPHDLSPTCSLHSISDSSPPVTPSSNNVSDEIINDISDTARRNTFTSPDDQIDLGFVLVPSKNLSNNAQDNSESVQSVEDVEDTLKPADLKSATECTTASEVSMEYDTAVPPGESDTLVIIKKNKSAKNNSSMLVEDQVIGFPGNKFSINDREDGSSSVDLPPLSAAKLLVRRTSKRAMISLPELKISRLTSFGATSPEYYTPTDCMLYVCL